MKSKVLIALIGFVFVSYSTQAQNKADDIIGIWLTNGNDPAKIQIYKNGEKFYGKIVWLKYPDDNGKPKVDKNNNDKVKRINPIIGLIMLVGFKFNGDDEWKGGTIYDPESGKTYSSFMSLKDNSTLKVKGYIGISLFGRTETWKRVN